MTARARSGGPAIAVGTPGVWGGLRGFVVDTGGVVGTSGQPHAAPPPWALDPSLSEADGLARLLADLTDAGWSVLGREVVGQHLTGSLLRIDAVLGAPDSDRWHPGSRVWGLEVKRPVLPEDSTAHAALVVQASDYHYVDWEGFGLLPAMIWPEPFARFGHDQSGPVRSNLSRLRVPPLRWEPGHGWWLGLGLTRIWSQHRGPSSHAGRCDCFPAVG